MATPGKTMAIPGSGLATAEKTVAKPGSGLATPEDLLAQIVECAMEKKAKDVLELDMRGVLGYTDWFVICTGNTERQTKAIHDGIVQGCKRELQMTPRRVEGLGTGDWVLMDYMDVVVHVFTPATREYYRLERLWGEVPARTVV